MRQLTSRNLQTVSVGAILETISDQRQWLTTLIFVNFLDMVSTALGLQLGIPEGNPVQASLLADHGELAMFLSKIFLVACLVMAMHVLRHRYNRLWPFWLAIIAPTVLVVTNNLLIILRTLA